MRGLAIKKSNQDNESKIIYTMNSSITIQNNQFLLIFRLIHRQNKFRIKIQSATCLQ